MSHEAVEVSEEMTLEEARAIGVKIADEVLEDVRIAFETMTLEAAAMLRDQDKPGYAALAEAIKASNVNSNDWQREVKEAVNKKKAEKRRAFDPRPVIEDRAELHEVVDEACEALKALPGVYERFGALVEIVDGVAPDGVVRPEIKIIREMRLRELLSRAARFERWTADGNKAIKPTKEISGTVHARNAWGLPPLRGFVDGACMLENGDILATNGYHPSANTFVRNGVDIAGLRKPSKADAEAAYKTLTDLICDFELVKESRAAQEAAWVATLLTIIARPAIKGSTPLFLYEANKPRIGKSRLADLACVIATGKEANKQPYPGGRDPDTELAKIITSTVIKGSHILFFDNVKGRLGGAALELAITTNQWEGRIMKESSMAEGELALTWIASSNSATLTPDMHGRTIPISQWTDLEHPEHRTGFKYTDIMGHVAKNRETYIRAALTVLRAWHVAGRPEHEMKAWGSFESWSAIIRNAILFAGGVDPMETRVSLKSADTETEGLLSILLAWPEGERYSAAELEDIVANSKKKSGGGLFGGSAQEDALGDALREFCRSSSAIGIGMRLGPYQGRTVEGMRLVRERSGDDRIRRWSVETITK